MSKTILKTTIFTLLLVALSCSKDDSIEQEQQQQVIPSTTVTNMSPLSGPKATIVTFTGTSFGDDINTVQVFFDDIETTVQSVSNTQIQTTVPPRAFFGAVTLIINGIEFTGFNFDYQIVDVLVSTHASPSGGLQLDRPFGIVLDPQGNLYVSDSNNHIIRKVTQDGVITTFAGSGISGFADGSDVNAQFNFPSGLAIDNTGNIYVADQLNHKIRKINPSGVVSTLAGSTEGFLDGIGNNAQFSFPAGVTIDTSENLYVTDSDNNVIRKITPNGDVSTFAGSGTFGFADGEGSNAKFHIPIGIDIDTSNNLYVADMFNHSIRKINANGQVSTICGNDTPGFVDGLAANARFDHPICLTLDPLGNIYVSDRDNARVRKISTNGQVSTIAGSTFGDLDGIGSSAQFKEPRGLIIDETFTIYHLDAQINRVRKITQE